MHQPRAIANKERIRLVHREVVHHLRLSDNRDPLDCAKVIFAVADLIC